MKQQGINQEILLFTNTSFSKRELCENDGVEKKEPGGSSAEQLEKACWSGLLFELLSDIVNKSEDIYIREITLAEKFISITLGNASSSVRNETSIDPYFFLQPQALYN